MADDQTQDHQVVKYVRIVVTVTLIVLPTVQISGYILEDDKRVHATAPPAEDTENQTAQQLERDAKRALRGRDFRWIEIFIEGTKATLVGQAPDFWAKDQAIRRVLDVDGIETVASALELPEGENDDDIAQAVGKAIQRYGHYTMWDHITGRVNGGKVYLGGHVTPERNKADELFERVAKVKGVQDVQSDILTLSPSQSDRKLRHLIAWQLSSNIHFERFARMVNPPVHIVVNNGVITLVGYVQTQIELIEMQSIVGQTPGVLRIENRLKTVQGTI